MALSRETTERQSNIWDQLSGKGPFSIMSKRWLLRDGTEADAIHVYINPGAENEQAFVVLHPGTHQEHRAKIILKHGEQRLQDEEVEFPFQ